MAAGTPAALYVGSRWLPRHVVLVTGGDDATLWVYEPASGRTVPVTRADVVGARLRVAGWHVAWFTVVPGGR